MAPKLILFGNPEELQSVEPLLGKLRVQLERVASDQSVEAAIRAAQSPKAVAVLATAISGKSARIEDTRELCEAAPVPTFALVPDSIGMRVARALYRAGAAGLVEWPREASILVPLLAEMLALQFVRGRPEQPDAALARVVRAHLRLVRGLSPLPNVEVRSGLVSLYGTLDSLADKREAVRCVADISGVRSLSVDELHVVPSEPISDQTIQRACGRLIENMDLNREIGLSVEKGAVMLDGPASHRVSLRRMAHWVGNVNGVRDVTTRIHFPQADVARSEADSKLRELVSTVAPTEAVQVDFFGGVAVLSGSTRSLRAKHVIEAFVADDPSVDRIVNKIAVLEIDEARSAESEERDPVNERNP